MQIDVIVEKYIQLRDKKTQLTADLKAKTEQIDEAMDKCERFIMTHLNANGLDSCGSAAGTAYKASVTSATVADWNQLLAYVRENNMWNMLDRRVNKTAVTEFKDANDDLPPGINWREETVVRIRRPS
jgi:hypothetical protein